MGNILESARDIGQEFYTKAETDTGLGLKADTDYVDNKPTGFKNYIINGGFDVWQRGTSVATISNAIGVYTADRWFTNQYGYGGTQTVSKDYTEVDGGIISTLKSTQTTVCVNRCMSILEDISCLNLRGKTVTLSFWAKRVGNDGTFFIGSGNDSVYNSSNFLIDLTPSTSSYAVINSSVWKKYSISHYIPNNSQIAIGFVQQNGSVGDYVQIANVQLEEGSVATPFEHRPYGLELSLCQRYYSVLSTYLHPDQQWIRASLYNTVDFRRFPTTINIITQTGGSGTMTFVNGGIASEVRFYNDGGAPVGGSDFVLVVSASAEL